MIPEPPVVMPPEFPEPPRKQMPAWAALAFLVLFVWFWTAAVYGTWAFFFLRAKP